MGLKVRYPSLQSKGKWVYAKGYGTTDDPCVLYFKPRSSDLGLYANYKRNVSETGFEFRINFLFDTEWYRLPNIFNQELLSTWTAEGIVDVWKKYRLFYPPCLPWDMPERADLCMIESYVVSGDPNGEVIIVFVNNTYPDPQPHIVDGYTRVHLGSIKINTRGIGHWKIYYDSDWRESGDIVSELGIGYHLITFEEVEGNRPDDIFVEVTENNLTELEVSYP